MVVCSATLHNNEVKKLAVSCVSCVVCKMAWGLCVGLCQYFQLTYVYVCARTTNQLTNLRNYPTAVLVVMCNVCF